jgi:hypothetical protein
MIEVELKCKAWDKLDPNGDFIITLRDLPRIGDTILLDDGALIFEAYYDPERKDYVDLDVPYDGDGTYRVVSVLWYVIGDSGDHAPEVHLEPVDAMRDMPA